MKTVFSSSELVHKYAQRTQSEGRSYNMFFSNDRIYSYGRHYELGRFIDDNTILINNRGYSLTTRKHIGLLMQATRQYKQYYAMDVDLSNVYPAIMEAYNKLPKARKKEIYASEIIRLFESLTKYSEIYAPNQLSDPKYKTIEEIYTGVKSNLSSFIEAAKKREAAKKTAIQTKFKEDKTLFLTYEIDRIYSECLIDVLRLSKCGKYVETSQEVKINLNEAKALFLAIKANKDIRGHQMEGGYIVKGIKNNILSIGCHNIELDNINQIGNLLNF